MPDEGAVVVDVGIDGDLAEEDRALAGLDDDLDQVVVDWTLNQPKMLNDKPIPMNQMQDLAYKKFDLILFNQEWWRSRAWK